MKVPIFRIAVVAVAAIVIAGICQNSWHGQVQAQDPNGDESRIQQGFAIAPVPLNLSGKNRASVGLGSYLVNAIGGCNDCHTNPSYATGGNPFLGQPEQVNTTGYLAGGMAFGPFISRNITPDSTGLPASLTLDQFINVIRTGEDPLHLHPQLGSLLQVMPWPAFRKMSDHDLEAIYDYLSTIPCVEGGPGQPANRCQ